MRLVFVLVAVSVLTPACAQDLASPGAVGFDPCAPEDYRCRALNMRSRSDERSIIHGMHHRLKRKIRR